MSASDNQNDVICSSPSARGGLSARGGRGGGFIPKKRLQPKMDSLEFGPIEKEGEMDMDNDKKEVNDDQNLSRNVQTVNKFQLPVEDSGDSSDSDSDSTKKPKRCDFCGDTNHQNRFCPVLEQIDNCQDGRESIKKPNKPFTCFYCHEQGHARADCPKRVLNNCCYYCKKEGHIRADCPEKANQEAKKRERVRLNYTFRKTASHEQDASSTANNIADAFYEGPVKEEESNAPKPPRVPVPFPVKASQIKPQVQLRSKLMSSDSEPSVSHKIVRSESSEEEDMESFGDDSGDEGSNSKENHPEDTKTTEKEKSETVVGEKVERANKDEVPVVIKDALQEGGEELQTISVEVDGCVEFDSGDDRSYYDCSEGEDVDGKLKRIVEEDEYYGEDGALLVSEAVLDEKVEGADMCGNVADRGDNKRGEGPENNGKEEAMEKQDESTEEKNETT